MQIYFAWRARVYSVQPLRKGNAAVTYIYSFTMMCMPAEKSGWRIGERLSLRPNQENAAAVDVGY
jgi:hypothetical protein